MILAINIRRARNRLRLSVEEVAKAVELTVEEYERIERGNFPPSARAFLALVEVLGVPADQLLIALEPPQLRIVRNPQGEEASSSGKPPSRPSR